MIKIKQKINELMNLETQLEVTTEKYYKSDAMQSIK